MGSRKPVTLERFKATFTANDRNDHVTMFILHLPLAVFSFSAKLSSFALASKVSPFFYYSHLCPISFFQENLNANLTFAVCHNAILNLSIVSQASGPPSHKNPHYKSNATRTYDLKLFGCSAVSWPFCKRCT